MPPPCRSTPLLTLPHPRAMGLPMAEGPRDHVHCPSALDLPRTEAQYGPAIEGSVVVLHHVSFVAGAVDVASPVVQATFDLDRELPAHPREVEAPSAGRREAPLPCGLGHAQGVHREQQAALSIAH